VRATPLRAVAAAEREAVKRATYVPALPVSDPPHAFTPLLWEALKRVGPATDASLKAELAGPKMASVVGIGPRLSMRAVRSGGQKASGVRVLRFAPLRRTDKNV